MRLDGETILFSEMTPPASLEPAFNQWYDEEHIPLRMGAPGFRSAQRYRDGNTSNYLAVYEMTGRDALATPEYGQIKNRPSETTKGMLTAVTGFTRYIGNRIAQAGAPAEELMSSPVLYAVFFTVPQERLADFDTWNEDDHLPLLLEDERWLGVRRFEIVDGAPQSFNRLALHHLSDRSALDSDARKRARATPWRARLAAESWFQGHYIVFDRLGDRQIGKSAA